MTSLLFTLFIIKKLYCIVSTACTKDTFIAFSISIISKKIIHWKNIIFEKLLIQKLNFTTYISETLIMLTCICSSYLTLHSWEYISKIMFPKSYIVHTLTTLHLQDLIDKASIDNCFVTYQKSLQNCRSTLLIFPFLSQFEIEQE